jgi:hypothetical protein
MRTIYSGSETMKLHDNGQIERLGFSSFGPSPSWTVIGAVRYNNFGHVVERFTLADILSHKLQWHYNNGKQRIYLRDLDHGSMREWRSPSHEVV